VVGCIKDGREVEYTVVDDFVERAGRKQDQRDGGGRRLHKR